MTDLRAKAERLRALHRTPPILVLPNAWDAVSAIVFERAGFPAVATTSAGMAYALGAPDGERIDRDEMIAAVGRVARSVDVPVTADMEAGFGDVAATVRGIVAAGAVGMNLEDAYAGHSPAKLYDITEQVARIRLARATAESLGVPVVINARTDVYLKQIGPAEKRFDAAVERLIAYRDAGADSLFLPGVIDPALLAAVVAKVGAPLNVLAVAGTPPVAELERLGVARVTVGVGPVLAVIALTSRIARELKEKGTFSFTADALPYAEVQALFRR